VAEAGGQGAGSATILGCLGTELSAVERAFFRDADPLGFILFARNVETPDQVLRLTQALRETVGRDAPVLIDQEGGRVQRLRAPHWREWLPPLDHVTQAGPSGFARAVWLRYRIIAAELRSVGIDVNCAVTADIAGPATHPFLRNRCFGDDPETVIDAARAAAAAHLDGGVLPVMKHMPGHGRASADSHHNLPVVEADPEDLHDTDFAVFSALSHLPLGMTAHVVFTGIDPDRPATTSPALVQVIRDEIGFGGLLMTDDISMQALSGDVGARAAAAVAAGVDVVLHCNGNRAEATGVVAAAGTLDGVARARADAALALRAPARAIDTALLADELGALLKGRAHG
jgi:beta-N-acetylhexosaminidase